MNLFNMFKPKALPYPSRKAKKQGIRHALYDFAQERNPAGGAKRRPSRVETTGEEGILTPNLRYRALNLARDSERNYASVAGWLQTVKVNVVGDAGKLKFNRTGEWYSQAANWFNRTWSRHADYRDGSSWRETLQLIVASIVREGDLVVQIDRSITDSAKIVIWEADQIANLDEAGWQPYAAKGFTQTQGVIKDRFGRLCGVIVTPVRGAQAVSAAQAFVLTCDPNDPDSADWRLVRRKYRCNQDRGTAMILPAVTGVIDSQELLQYELQSAKVGASRYAAVVEAADQGGIDIPGGFDEIEDAEGQGEGQTGGDGGDLEDVGRALGLEDYSGGHVDYIPAGSNIVFDPANRPAGQLPAFLDYQQRSTGSALGLVGSLATNNITSSYSGFRGEMVLSWMTFRSHQQWIEDDLLDWVAYKVISWAIEHGTLDAPPDDDWSDYIAWTWPTCPQIDGSKEQDALTKKLRNGLTSYREQLGPDWREKLAQYAEELQYARSIGLDSLAVFDGQPQPAPVQILPTQDINEEEEE